MQGDAARARDREVAAVRRRLLRRGAPRLAMAALVAATGLSGLAASMVLRRAGLAHMGLRYGLAVVAAYAVYVLLLGGWLLWRRRAAGANPLRLGPLLSVGPTPPLAGDGAAPGPGAVVPVAPSAFQPRAHGAPGGGGFAAFHLADLVVDELLVPSLVILALGSAAFAVQYLVTQAPTTFAELIVDGELSVGLYRRLGRGDDRSWWPGAVRRTIAPALVALAFFAAAGTALAGAFPGATTLGEAYRALALWLGGPT